MNKWIKDYPWRMIQTNLREIDMIDIDAEQYVKELKAFNATVALINVGGIIASYQSELSFHFQSPYLKGDKLQKIIDACHKAGIKVMARNDFSKIRRSLYEQHPDWAYKNSEGKIVDYNGDIHGCVNSEYQKVYVLKIMEEIIEKLDIDGVFFNMGGYLESDYSHNYYGICHCDNCKRLFNDMYGFNLPAKADMSDPIYRKYMLFQRRTIKKYKKNIVDLIHTKNKDIAINGVDLVRQESNTDFGHPLPHWQYSGSSNTRWVRTTYPERRSSNTTVDFIGYAYRHVAISPAQQELRLWQNLANTGDLDYYIIGRLDNHQDKSGYESVKRVFNYHAQNEKDYLNLKSCSDILLVREKTWDSDTEDLGWIRFLTEKHYLFDEVQANALEKIDIKKYKAIVLANSRYLSNSTIKLIDSYAYNGGIVISVGESGLCDEDFEPQDEQRIKCLGINGSTIKRDDMRSAMLLIDEKSNYPTFDNWDAELIYFGDSFLFCNYENDVKKHLKLVPPHDFGPPERCYYTQVTDTPGFVINNYGKGKGAHIPWYPGKLYYREGYVNTLEFIGDILKFQLKIEPIKTNLSPMVEITLSKGNDFSLLQLVNTSGHFGNTFFEPVPIFDIEVEIPYDKKPEICFSLNDGSDSECIYTQGKLKIKIDKLDQFEAIKII